MLDHAGWEARRPCYQVLQHASEIRRRSKRKYVYKRVSTIYLSGWLGRAYMLQ